MLMFAIITIAAWINQAGGKQKIHKTQKDTQHYLVCADYWKVISVVCFVNCKSGCYYDKLQRAPPTGEVLQDYKLGGNNAK